MKGSREVRRTAIEVLSRAFTPERIDTLNLVTESRTKRLTVVLEDAIRPQQIGSCLNVLEAYGIHKVHLVDTYNRLPVDMFKGGNDFDFKCGVQEQLKPILTPLSAGAAVASVAAAVSAKPLGKLIDPKKPQIAAQTFLRKAMDRLRLLPGAHYEPRSAVATTAVATVSAAVSAAAGPAAAVVGPIATAVASAAAGPLASLATRAAADSIHHVDRMALLFGGHDQRITSYARGMCDGMFSLPGMGVVPIFDTDAAVAVTLTYLNSWGGIQPDLTEDEKEKLILHWLLQHHPSPKAILRDHDMYDNIK
ncbi:rRNA methylase [Planoprotostelium fungivorum]|uniref:rRNA methylase n=1 Tax=Planoprotostelium fungivorum TaxID=1890364 RepID=A0A2P6MP24_9EUKA|nr:rRNA methylase [Planoprotostelium fungivorum]